MMRGHLRPMASAMRQVLPVEVLRLCTVRGRFLAAIPTRHFPTNREIFVSVQPFSTTLFGVPFPLLTPQGRRDSQLRTMPECEIRMLRKATPRDMEATSANLLRKECQDCSEARRPSRTAPRFQSSGATVTSQRCHHTLDRIVSPGLSSTMPVLHVYVGEEPNNCQLFQCWRRAAKLQNQNDWPPTLQI
jgi:hypothetical protein